jgi:DNA-binding IclR family transcriptional regulator
MMLGASAGEGELAQALGRRAHNLPAASTVQRSLDTMVQEELVERAEAGYRIAEPFLAEWIARGDL